MEHTRNGFRVKTPKLHKDIGIRNSMINEFPAIICSIDDFKDRFPELNENEIQTMFEMAKHKISDLLMEDYWICLDTLEHIYQTDNKWKNYKYE